MRFCRPSLDEMVITWPVVAGRDYRVMCSGDLASEVWEPAFGPQTAQTNGHMSWSTPLANATNPNYRVEVVPFSP